MDEFYRESFPFSDFSNGEDASESSDTMKPFERFLKNPGIDMLNSALPYVSSTMRKPLALYIKALEIHRIVNDFDREEVLSACGFEKNAPNPEAMLKAMKMAGGKNASPQIDSLLNMMNMLRAYQSFNEMLKNNPEMASFITNMMNQGQNFGQSYNGNTSSNSNNNPDNNAGGNTSANSHGNGAGSVFGGGLSPADLLSQLAGKDSSDMMALLSQMLKNS